VWTNFDAYVLIMVNVDVFYSSISLSLLYCQEMLVFVALKKTQETKPNQL
jgi:hypothetical protein